MSTYDAEAGRRVAESGKHWPREGPGNGQYPDDLDSEPTGDDGETESLLTSMFTAAELQSMRFDALREYVPDLVVEGFGVLGGGPKIGKSWMALNFALACAADGYALGHIKTQKCPVLYLALEDGQRRLQSRMTKIEGGGWPDDLCFITVVKRGQVLATLKEWFTRHPKSLVILDTLSKNRPPARAGENQYLADYSFSSALKTVVDEFPGAALLAVHHTRKMPAEDFIDTLSGSQGLAGAADYVLVLTRKRNSNEAVISVTGRDIEENEYALTVNNGVWELDGMDILDAAATMTTRRERDKEANLGSRSLDAMKFVNSRDTTTPMELAKKLGIDNNSAGKVLQRLADDEYIAKSHRGTYTPVVSGKSVVNAGQASPGNTTDTTVTTPLFEAADE